MAKITEKEKARIYAMEKIKVAARLRGTFTSKAFYFYLAVLIAVFFCFFSWLDRSSGKSDFPLLRLKNEIKVNTALLSSIATDNSLRLKNKESYRTYSPDYINQEVLSGSLKWAPQRFADLNTQDRFELLKAGLGALRANELVEELADPSSKASQAVWEGALRQELAAIAQYQAAAGKVEASLDAQLKGSKGLEKLRIQGLLSEAK